MKIKVSLFILFVLLLSVVLSSYKNGAAVHNGTDGTGAEGPGGCSSGGGCHNATTVNNTVVELDSAGVPVTVYYPGASYTVKISATNNTSGTFADFGFQLATVLTANAGTASATQAGTWGTTLPTNVRLTAASSSGLNIPIIEQKAALPALSGSGGVGTTYGVSIPWTAPAAGTGAIQIYGVINAVSGLDIAFFADYQAASPITIYEAGSSTGIDAVNESANNFKVYPSPMNDRVNISFDIHETTVAALSLISVDGRVVRSWANESITAGPHQYDLDVNGIRAGVYLVRLEAGGTTITSKIVKE